MKHFFRYFFFIFSLFSLNLNFIKAITNEEEVVNYVVDFFRSNKINKNELNKKINTYIFAKQLQTKSFPNTEPESIADISIPEDETSIPNTNFIPEPDTDLLAPLAKKIIEKECFGKDATNLNLTLQQISSKASGLLNDLNEKKDSNSIRLMKYLISIPLETLIIIPIVSIFTEENFSINLQVLEQQIKEYYSRNTRINSSSDNLKNKVALMVRVKLFEKWKNEVKKNKTEHIKQKIQNKITDIMTKIDIIAQQNLSNLLLQISLNAQNEQEIIDNNGNKGAIIWISNTRAFVILSVTGTFIASYYLSHYYQFELSEQIETLWEWIRNFQGIIPIKE